MSCLPDIFVNSKSQNIILNKVGGQFSIHLRSAFFSNKPSQNVRNANSFSSADTKRYRSWMDSEQTFKKTRRSTKSFFRKQEKSQEKVIQERGFSNQNINARESQLSEVQAVGNFNLLKKAAFQSMHLSQKVLEQAASEQQKIKQQMSDLKKNIFFQMQDFQNEFSKSIGKVYKAFKEQRRIMIAQGKAIAQQVSYLEQESTTTKSICSQLQQTFSRVIKQFL